MPFIEADNPKADLSQLWNQDSGNGYVEVHYGKTYEELLAEGGLSMGPIPFTPSQATPEVSPTPDPYAESDLQNQDLINEMVRESNNEEFSLANPYIFSLGKLNIQPMLPDVSFGILADSQGNPYAFIYNHDMDCVRDPMDEAGLIEDTIVEDGPARGTFFDAGITEVHLSQMASAARVDTMQVERFIDEYTLRESGITLPVLVVKGFDLNGQEYDCPTMTERAQDTFGSTGRSVAEGISNVDLLEILEQAGEAIGRGLNRFGTGLSRGLGDN